MNFFVRESSIEKDDNFIIQMARGSEFLPSNQPDSNAKHATWQSIASIVLVSPESLLISLSATTDTLAWSRQIHGIVRMRRPFHRVFDESNGLVYHF